MWFFFYQNQQITRYTVVLSGISFTPHRELHTFCYSGRNLYGYYFFAIFDAFSSTNLTLVFNDLTFTITSRTCGTRLHSSQDRLLVADDRSASFAGRASLRTAVSFRPGSMAMRTRHIFFQLKFLFNSCRDFFQIQLYFHSEVRATEFSLLRTSASKSAKASETTTESAAAMAAKNITEHRENVVHRHSAAKSAERSTVSGCSAHSCMTKLVVAGTFIRVAQYVVGFGCFFKLFFRFLVTRIFVRMILDGFFPVCFLYFFDC